MTASRTAATTAASRTAATTAASQIAAAMGVGSYVTYTASTDPNHLLGRQGGYTSKINWPSGSSIEVFPDSADAQAREQYVQAFRCPFGDGYDYLDGVALLRLSCALTPSQAQADEKLFGRVISKGTR